MSQAVDPAVSRRKFDREVGQLREIEPTLVSRGWWIMSAEFPIVKVGFATVRVRPRVVPFAVRVDFTDYDVLPLSLIFVDPFEDRELLPAQMMTHLPRLVHGTAPVPTEQDEPVLGQVLPLYQSYPAMPHLPGFLCLPGTRAYHSHPAHSGDPWELHRHLGEGRLFTLLETVWRYGTSQLTQLTVNLGLGQAEFAA